MMTLLDYNSAYVCLYNIQHSIYMFYCLISTILNIRDHFRVFYSIFDEIHEAHSGGSFIFKKPKVHFSILTISRHIFWLCSGVSSVCIFMRILMKKKNTQINGKNWRKATTWLVSYFNRDLSKVVNLNKSRRD